MLIVGEKLNGTLKKTAAAIAARDGAFVQDLAQRQVAAGANYVDVNAGTPPEREPDDLVWLVDTVQAVVETPLCLDSANPAALAAALARVVRPPLINSISGEKKRLDGVLPLASGRSAGVVALLLDDNGIPKDVAGRLAVARRILECTRAAGLADEQVFVDPLAIAVSTRQDGALMALDTMRALRAEAPAGEVQHRSEQYFVRTSRAHRHQPCFPHPGHSSRSGRGDPRPSGQWPIQRADGGRTTPQP